MLAVVYLIFNEGHTASAGDRLAREDLCAEAIRLGRLLAALMPDEPEVMGLLALMLLVHARRDARTTPAGDLVPRQGRPVAAARPGRGGRAGVRGGDHPHPQRLRAGLPRPAPASGAGAGIERQAGTVRLGLRAGIVSGAWAHRSSRATNSPATAGQW